MLDARGKITRGRIQLQRTHPFFAYLVLNLNPIEMTKEQEKECEAELGFASMAVNLRGDLIYSPTFVDSLSDEDLQFVLCHEVSHIFCEHLTRLGNRHPLIHNISADIIVNDLLLNNGFNFSDKHGAILPVNHEFMLDNYKVKDIDKKTTEGIYDEIEGLLRNKLKKLLEGNKLGRFDRHIQASSNGKSANMSKEEIEKLKKAWKHKVIEATTIAKNAGNVPLGLDRHIEALLDEKINWRALLYRYVTNTLVHDYSYSFPSKKSLASGIYMPHLKKEELEIVVIADRSGSISQ